MKPLTPKTKKILIGVGIGLVLTVATVFIVKAATKKKPATAATTNTPAVAGSPPLKVTQDTNQTDNYIIAFGPGVFYYTKGSTPVVNAIDSQWSIKAETSQDEQNMLQLTVLQNGNIVQTLKFY